MQKSKKSKSCGCFGAFFKSKNKNNAKEYYLLRKSSTSEATYHTRPVQNVIRRDTEQLTERHAKTDTNFYPPQRHMTIENDSLPGFPTHYKSTIVSTMSKSHGNSSFRRGPFMPIKESVHLPQTEREFKTDSQESTQKFMSESRKQFTPPFHDVSGMMYRQLPQIQSRPMSQDYVPNLFDTNKLKRGPLSSLPHLMPVTPARFKRNNNMPPARDNNKFEYILSDLKREFDEEPRVVID